MCYLLQDSRSAQKTRGVLHSPGGGSKSRRLSQINVASSQEVKKQKDLGDCPPLSIPTNPWPLGFPNCTFDQEPSEQTILTHFSIQDSAALGMVAHTCDPSTLEAEAKNGGSL